MEINNITFTEKDGRWVVAIDGVPNQKYKSLVKALAKISKLLKGQGVE